MTTTHRRTIGAHHVPELSAGARRLRSSAIRDLLALASSDQVVSLAGGLPAPEHLPSEALSRHAAELLDANGPEVLQYGPTEGLDGLRRWVALHELGGVDPAEVLITHGAQQALDLLVSALVDPGDEVLVEARSYVGMLQPLAGAQAEVISVPGDAEGVRTLELAATLRSTRAPKLLYLAPTHQNPTGSVLSDARRSHVGRLAAHHGLVVIDDDPYRRLGFGPAPERLRAHVPDELAVTVGSFSKFVSPGLRVGWVHAPRWLIDAMVRIKQARDLHTSSFAQHLVLALVGAPGWLDSHLGEVRTTYGHRSAVLRARFAEHLGDRVRLGPVSGGMFAWAEFPDLPVDSDDLLRSALAHGVAFVPASAFSPHGTPETAGRVCFATVDEERMDLAAQRLARAVDAAWQHAGHAAAS